MTEVAEIQLMGSKRNKITNSDIEILDNLMRRTEDLPDVLHLRAAEAGYEFTDEDKTLLTETYLKLDDILKEVAAFINVKFPGCERHVRAWNKIDFDTKIGPFKIITTDREHIKSEWRKGMFDLKSLIKILKNEAILLVEEEENMTFSEKRNLTNGASEQRSWLEVLSWLAAILGTLISLYVLLK